MLIDDSNRRITLSGEPQVTWADQDDTQPSLDVDIAGEMVNGIRRDWIFLMFFLDEGEPWVRMTLEEATKLRDRLNLCIATLSPDKRAADEPDAEDVRLNLVQP